MSTAILPFSAGCPPTASGGRVTTVFLPKEHGSWSLALEPLALGLLITPSWAGGALGGALLAGFFARRPLKAALHATDSARRNVARWTLAMFSLLGGIGLAEAVVLAPWIALWPLLPAALFGGIFLYCEAQGESRAAGAEVAGSAACGCMPAVLATLAGWTAPAALALASLALARSVPAVLTVRSFLRLRKGGAPRRGWALFAAGLAALALGALALAGRVPWLAAGLGGMLLLRSLWLLGARCPAWPARVVGMFEAAAGLLYVGALVAAYHA